MRPVSGTKKCSSQKKHVRWSIADLLYSKISPTKKRIPQLVQVRDIPAPVGGEQTRTYGAACRLGQDLGVPGSRQEVPWVHGGGIKGRQGGSGVGIGWVRQASTSETSHVLHSNSNNTTYTPHRPQRRPKEKRENEPSHSHPAETRQPCKSVSSARESRGALSCRSTSPEGCRWSPPDSPAYLYRQRS